ncbi:hypothetical protein M5689_019272 [Euphorbia peplus]|nr:hypothetical protein M5689_019272 [Euphorbia peplus]
MKSFSIQSSKKSQFLNSGKRTVSTESAITLGNVKSRASFHYFCGSHILRQLLRKLRKQCKQALGWKKTSVKYSYDIYSYSLNFDDGLYHVHPPPKASQ